MKISVLVAVVFCLVVSPLVLADVTHEEETKMGGLMKIATFGKSMKTTTRLSGNRMRTDSGDEATIIDLDEEKIYELNIKKKTYTVMTFAEMREKMRAAMAEAKQKLGDAEAESQQEPEVTTSADITVTDTGRTEVIRGKECKQVLMELALTMTSEEDQQSATMSTVTEMWLTPDVEGGEEMQAFHVKMAEKLGTASLGRQFLAGGEGQTAQFGMDMNKMVDEMKKMDGFPMRSVFYFGSAEAAKREASGEKSESGGFGGMLKRMSGLPGAGGEEAEGTSDGGAVIMKMTTETTKIETKPIDADVFVVPDNYKLVASE